MLDSITASGTGQIDCSGKPEPAKVGEQEDREMVANLPHTNGTEEVTETTMKTRQGLKEKSPMRRGIRNAYGTTTRLRANRTRIELTTKESPREKIMESKIDRLLTLVHELGNRCVAQEQISQLTNFMTIMKADQDDKHRSNQLRMTATDSYILNIQKTIESVCATLNVGHRESRRQTATEEDERNQTNWTGRRQPVPIDEPTTATKGSDDDRMDGVDCGGLGQSRHAPEIAPGSTRTEGNTTHGESETGPKPKPVVPGNNINQTRQAGVPNREETQRGTWSKIVQGNFKKAEFTEMGNHSKRITWTIPKQRSQDHSPPP
jgi:hypothetical protein